MKKLALLFVSILLVSCAAPDAPINTSKTVTKSEDWQITVTKIHTVYYKGHTKEIDSDETEDMPMIIKWNSKEQTLIAYKMNGELFWDLNPKGKMIDGYYVDSESYSGDIATYDFSEIPNNKLIRTYYDHDSENIIGDDSYMEFY